MLIAPRIRAIRKRMRLKSCRRIEKRSFYIVYNWISIDYSRESIIYEQCMSRLGHMCIYSNYVGNVSATMVKLVIIIDSVCHEFQELMWYL